jgi:hypothetical protein
MVMELTGQIDDGNEIPEGLQGVDGEENPERFVFNPVSKAVPSRCRPLDTSPRLGKPSSHKRKEGEQKYGNGNCKDAQGFGGAVLGYQR